MNIDEQRLLNFLRENNFSGNVAIFEDQSSSFEASLGYAHKGFSIKNNLDIRYGLASITKMFTAIAILSLVDAGKCSLNDHVVQYIESSHVHLEKDLTIKELLTHSSGLPDYINEEDPRFAPVFSQ